MWALGAIVIIFGGIYSGVFSPTEAAGVACVYAIIVSYFVYRETTLQEIFETAARSMFLTGIDFHHRLGRGPFCLAADHQRHCRSTVSTDHQPAFRALGGPVGHKPVPAVRRLLPRPGLGTDHVDAAAAPVAAALGIDPIHFGVIVVMNLTIGTFHPPFGLNIFVCQALFKTPSQTLYMGLIPFVAIAVLALMLVTYIPAISLWIMHLLA